MSRPFLEHLVRQRVRALPNVSLRDNCAVRELLSTADRAQVTGVVVEQRATSEAAELRADLVVDCSGRASRAPQWREALGDAAAAETGVRGLRQPPLPARSGKPARRAVTPTRRRRRRTRFAGLSHRRRPLDCLDGRLGATRPPTSRLSAYARSLPMRTSTRSSAGGAGVEIVAHRYRASRRRHRAPGPRPRRAARAGRRAVQLQPHLWAGHDVGGDAGAGAGPASGVRARGTGRPGAGLLPPRGEGRGHPLAAQRGRRFPLPRHGGREAARDRRHQPLCRAGTSRHAPRRSVRAFLRVMNPLAPPQSLFHPHRLARAAQSAVGC